MEEGEEEAAREKGRGGRKHGEWKAGTKNGGVEGGNDCI